MTREMGTRGKDVAARLAADLDLDVVHQELVAQDIGRLMGVAESSVLRFLEKMLGERRENKRNFQQFSSLL